MTLFGEAEGKGLYCVIRDEGDFIDCLIAVFVYRVEGNDTVAPLFRVEADQGGSGSVIYRGKP